MKGEQTLDREFKEAYEKASNTKLRFPPDLMLHFYAYYKRATDDNAHYQLTSLNRSELVSAFKMNALFQVKNLTKAQAKQKYIDLVKKYIP